MLCRQKQICSKKKIVSDPLYLMVVWRRKQRGIFYGIAKPYKPIINSSIAKIQIL